jgi:L-amino acid N-acyltransferase YncA
LPNGDLRKPSDRIRLAGPEDGPAVQRIYAPFVAESAVSFELEPPSAAEMTKRIVATLPAHPWLVKEERGLVVGYAYAQPFAPRAAYAWSATTSIYLDSSVLGRGIGTELYRALIRVLELQGYRQLLAGITLPNPASVALHERSGFKPAATYRDVGWKLGGWHSVGWWQLTLAADRRPPSDVIPIDCLDPRDLAPALGGAPLEAG